MNETAVTDAQLGKLKLEIDDLERKKTWQYKLIQFIPLITALVAVGGLLLNTQQFLRAQEAQIERDRTTALLEEKRLKENAERETAAKERELARPFWERHIATYFEASNVAATIAVLPAEHPDRKKAERRFRELYHGSLVLVEEEDVMKAKVAFRNCLDEIDEACSAEPSKSFRLQRLSLGLANKCRASLASKWMLDLKDLYLQDEKPNQLP